MAAGYEKTTRKFANRLKVYRIANPMLAQLKY